MSHATAGLQRRWATILIVCSLLLSVLSAIDSILMGLGLETALFSPVNRNIYLFSVASLIIFLFFCFLIIRYGIEATIGAVALVLAQILVCLVAVSVALGVSGALGWFLGVALVLMGILSLAAAVAGARAGAFGFAGAWASIWVVGSALVWVLFSLPGITLLSIDTSTLASAPPVLTWAMGVLIPITVSLVGLVIVGVALTWALTLVLAGTVSTAWALAVRFVLFLAWGLVLIVTWTADEGMTATVIVGVLPGLGAYIAWRTLAGDDKYAFIWTAAMFFIAMGGTRFRGANLANANFTQATLKSADFRKANLTQTCWFRTKKLQLSHRVESYLKYQQVRRLVITGVGKDKNFDQLNLRGLNLCGTNLADASFIGTDLCEANLQDADLSGTKLVQTQLDKTDLTGACLTGACIQNWKITSSTQLDGIECDYVYMQLPTRENPDPCRQPKDESEIFEVGDFADFIRS